MEERRKPENAETRQACDYIYGELKRVGEQYFDLICMLGELKCEITPEERKENEELLKKINKEMYPETT